MSSEPRSTRRFDAPPERVFDAWTDPAVRGSDGTLVVVEFLPDGRATTVVLTHAGFDGPHVRDMHASGWNGCLDNLDRRVLRA